jgi:hypothetical protein
MINVEGIIQEEPSIVVMDIKNLRQFIYFMSFGNFIIGQIGETVY